MTGNVDNDPSGTTGRARRRLLAVAGPSKSWAELSDDEIDDLASRIATQMRQRLDEVGDRVE